jgi:MFS transporter, UMF1 family
MEAKPIRPRAVSPAILAWYIYDWAIAPYAVLVLTFIFATYFAAMVAPDKITGTQAWGWAITGSTLVIAVASPLLGAAIDHSGRRKPWLAAFTLLCVAATAGLWWIAPSPALMLPALLLVGLSNIGFGLSNVAYNAMLPLVAPPERLGLVSGIGWSVGYFGGLACLGLALAIVLPRPPPFGLDPASAETVRATMPLTALWFALFALPLFFVVPDGTRRDRREGGAGSSLGELAETVRLIWREKRLLRFLAANMLYIDGLNTIFAFGGIYAAGSFEMSVEQVLMFGIAMNLTAGLGAALFGLIEDRLSAHRTIFLSLILLLGLGATILLVRSAVLFWAAALALGLFVGPVQSASRSRLVQLAPPGMTARLFGFLALSGRATAFIAPAALALVTGLADSQRAGMATILPFLAGGLVLLGRPAKSGK